MRNQLAHDYDGAVVEKYGQTIVEAYIDELEVFRQRVLELQKNM